MIKICLSLFSANRCDLGGPFEDESERVGNRSKLSVRLTNLRATNQVDLALTNLIIKVVSFLCVKHAFNHAIVVLVVNKVNFEELSSCMFCNAAFLGDTRPYLVISVSIFGNIFEHDKFLCRDFFDIAFGLRKGGSRRLCIFRVQGRRGFSDEEFGV